VHVQRVKETNILKELKIESKLDKILKYKSRYIQYVGKMQRQTSASINKLHTTWIKEIRICCKEDLDN
jgi:hypothetical protein